MHKRDYARTIAATKFGKTISHHCTSKKRRDSKATGITLTGSRAPVKSLTNPQLRAEKEMFIERKKCREEEVERNLVALLKIK